MIMNAIRREMDLIESQAAKLHFNYYAWAHWYA